MYSSDEELPTFLPSSRKSFGITREESDNDVFTNGLLLFENLTEENKQRVKSNTPSSSEENNISEELENIRLENEIPLNRPSTPISLKPSHPQYFSNSEVTLLKCGYNSVAERSTLEDLLLKLEIEEIYELICQSGACGEIQNVNFFVHFILKSMSLHASGVYIVSCTKLLKDLFNNIDKRNVQFSSQDIFKILFNCSVNVMTSELFDFLPHDRITPNSYACEETVPEHWALNLKAVLFILSELLKECTISLDDLCIVVLYFLIMFIEAEPVIHLELRRCLTVALNRFSPDFWPTCCLRIGMSLMTWSLRNNKRLCYSYRIIKLIPLSSTNGAELRRYISVMILLNIIEDDSNHALEHSEEMYSLSMIMSILGSFYLIQESYLQVAVKFLDIFINHLNFSSEENEQLCKFLKKAETSILGKYGKLEYSPDTVSRTITHLVVIHTRITLKISKSVIKRVARVRNLCDLIDEQNENFDTDQTNVEPSIIPCLAPISTDRNLPFSNDASDFEENIVDDNFDTRQAGIETVTNLQSHSSSVSSNEENMELETDKSDTNKENILPSDDFSKNNQLFPTLSELQTNDTYENTAIMPKYLNDSNLKGTFDGNSQEDKNIRSDIDFQMLLNTDQFFTPHKNVGNDEQKINNDVLLPPLNNHSNSNSSQIGTDNDNLLSFLHDHSYPNSVPADFQSHCVNSSDTCNSVLQENEAFASIFETSEKPVDVTFQQDKFSNLELPKYSNSRSPIISASSPGTLNLDFQLKSSMTEIEALKSQAALETVVSTASISTDSFKRHNSIGRKNISNSHVANASNLVDSSIQSHLEIVNTAETSLSADLPSPFVNYANTFNSVAQENGSFASVSETCEEPVDVTFQQQDKFLNLEVTNVPKYSNSPSPIICASSPDSLNLDFQFKSSMTKIEALKSQAALETVVSTVSISTDSFKRHNSIDRKNVSNSRVENASNLVDSSIQSRQKIVNTAETSLSADLSSPFVNNCNSVAQENRSFASVSETCEEPVDVTFQQQDKFLGLELTNVPKYSNSPSPIISASSPDSLNLDFQLKSSMTEIKALKSQTALETVVSTGFQSICTDSSESRNSIERENVSNSCVENASNLVDSSIQSQQQVVNTAETSVSADFTSHCINSTNTCIEQKNESLKKNSEACEMPVDATFNLQEMIRVELTNDPSSKYSNSASSSISVPSPGSLNLDFQLKSSSNLMDFSFQKHKEIANTTKANVSPELQSYSASSTNTCIEKGNVSETAKKPFDVAFQQEQQKILSLELTNDPMSEYFYFESVLKVEKYAECCTESSVPSPPKTQTPIQSSTPSASFLVQHTSDDERNNNKSPNILTDDFIKSLKKALEMAQESQSDPLQHLDETIYKTGICEEENLKILGITDSSDFLSLPLIHSDVATASSELTATKQLNSSEILVSSSESNSPMLDIESTDSSDILLLPLNHSDVAASSSELTATKQLNSSEISMSIDPMPDIVISHCKNKDKQEMPNKSPEKPALNNNYKLNYEKPISLFNLFSNVEKTKNKSSKRPLNKNAKKVGPSSEKRLKTGNTRTNNAPVRSQAVASTSRGNMSITSRPTVLHGSILSSNSVVILPSTPQITKAKGVVEIVSLDSESEDECVIISSNIEKVSPELITLD